MRGKEKNAEALYRPRNACYNKPLTVNEKKKKNPKIIIIICKTVEK